MDSVSEMDCSHAQWQCSLYYKRINLRIHYIHNPSLWYLCSEAQVYFLFQYWCCGATRYYQWNETVWFSIGTNKANTTVADGNYKLKVPDSCCKPPVLEGCGEVTHPSNINYKVFVEFFS